MDKLRRWKVFVLIVSFFSFFTFFFLLYIWYSHIYLIQEAPLPNVVREKILKLEEVDFDRLIDGKWDSIIILSPYCDLKGDAEKFHFNYRRLANKSIEYREGQNLFIFCNEDEIESYVYIPTSLALIDHDNLPYSVKISRTDAKFKLIKEHDTKKLIFGKNLK